MTEPSLFSRLIKSAGVRVLALFINIGVAFFMMPFVVHQLGDHWYGIWVIIGTIIGYYGLIDFGLGAACQRFIAKAYGLKSTKEVNIAISTAFFSFILLGILSLLITIVIAFLSSSFFDSADDAEIFSILMLIMGCKLLITLPFSAYNGVLSANMRYDIASNIQIFKTVTRAILFYYVLTQGFGIIGLAIITTTIDVISSFFLLYYAQKIDNNIQVKKVYFFPQRLEDFLNFGKYVFITDLANIFRFQLDSLVIGAFLSLSLVTHYSIAMRLIEYKGQLFGSIMGMFIPIFTKMHAAGDTEKLALQLRIVMTISSYFALLFCGSAILYGHYFISLWMGENYTDAYPPLIIVAIASSIGLTSMPLVLYLNAIAKHRYYAITTLIESLFNIGLSIFLVQEYGMIGVAFGTAIPAIISKLFFLIPYSYKKAGIPLRLFFIPFIGRYMITVSLFLISYALIQYKFGSPTQYYELLLLGMMTSLCYSLIFFKFLLDENTTTYLKGKLSVKCHIFL
jgi:O-antigen/teichoic acid export membrane protein